MAKSYNNVKLLVALAFLTTSLAAATAMAHDKMLDTALSNSANENSDIEQQYKHNLKPDFNSKKSDDGKKVSVELGDGS